MFRSKLLIVLAVVALAILPAGLAQAQEETTGTAVISDSVDGSVPAAGGSITYKMANVTAPAAGSVLVGWLVSDDGDTKLNTGAMTVATDGTIHHHYTSPTGQNLIHTNDKVVITLEAEADADAAGPAGPAMFSHLIPAGGIAHIRHLLTNWPPGADNGILTDLKVQLDAAILHATLAKNSTTLDDIRKHAHRVINIIEGADGANYDASFGDPGDGIGVLAHAANRKHGPFASGAAAEDAVIVVGALLVDTTGKNAADWATLARDIALNDVLPTDNIDLAKIFLGPGGGSVVSTLEAARNGFDADDDGTIEAIAGEGGAEQAYVQAQLMATFTLLPGPPPAPATAGSGGPSIGLPSVGDTSVPRLAQFGLIVAIVLLGTGGALLVRGRRTRTRA